MRFLTVVLTTVFAISTAMAAANELAPAPPLALLANGRVDEAISALALQVRTSPNDALAHNLLCRAYFSLGEWDRGVSNCEKAVALAPDNSEFHLWLGRIYGQKADKSPFMIALGLAKRVRNEFEAAVRLSPRNVDARTDLAEFYVEAPGLVGGGRDKAEQQANSLRDLDPAMAHWVNARIAEKKKDYHSAEREYRALVDSTGGSAFGWVNLGIFYKHRGNYDAMEEALSHLRSAPVDRPDALVDAAELLIRARRNPQEAILLLDSYLSSRAMVELAPAFKAHYLLGTAQEQVGDKQAAAAEYRSALALARDFQPAQQALARLNR